jgi:RNA polymerase sigma factor (sigma-70 family)
VSDERLQATERRRRFDTLYRRHYAAIYRYVYRRLGAGVSDTPDVVAEVFAVAWRRIEDVPAAPEDRLWLFGVARRRVLRAQRSQARYLRLRVRLHRRADTGADDELETGAAIRDAIARLRPADREVLRLVLWDGLSHAEAATVMGCSTNAIALRVSRARRRLRHELGVVDAVTGARVAPKARS